MDRSQPLAAPADVGRGGGGSRAASRGVRRPASCSARAQPRVGKAVAGGPTSQSRASRGCDAGDRRDVVRAGFIDSPARLACRPIDEIGTGYGHEVTRTAAGCGTRIKRTGNLEAWLAELMAAARVSTTASNDTLTYLCSLMRLAEIIGSLRGRSNEVGVNEQPTPRTGGFSARGEGVGGPARAFEPSLPRGRPARPAGC